jgi:hypothetical protein
MKLLRVERKRFIFRLSKSEKRLFLAVLDRYPLVPSAHQPLSKATAREADQRLLDDALAEHRRENKKQLRTLLKSKRRFATTKTGCDMKLSAGDIEWLLQVLNDVRIGSWIALGSPDDDWRMVMDDGAAAHACALELSGYFQSQLLQALREAERKPRARKPRRKR